MQVNIKPRLKKVGDTWTCSCMLQIGFGITPYLAYQDLLRQEQSKRIGMHTLTEWWRQPTNWWEYQILC